MNRGEARTGRAWKFPKRAEPQGPQIVWHEALCLTSRPDALLVVDVETDFLAKRAIAISQSELIVPILSGYIAAFICGANADVCVARLASTEVH